MFYEHVITSQTTGVSSHDFQTYSTIHRKTTVQSSHYICKSSPLQVGPVPLEHLFSLHLSQHKWKTPITHFLISYLQKSVVCTQLFSISTCLIYTSEEELLYLCLCVNNCTFPQQPFTGLSLTFPSSKMQWTLVKLQKKQPGEIRKGTEKKRKSQNTHEAVRI